MKIGKIIQIGGVGFIGCYVPRTLSDWGFTDITVVDYIASTLKWKNLSNKRYSEHVHKDQLLEGMKSGEFKNVEEDFRRQV